MWLVGWEALSVSSSQTANPIFKQQKNTMPTYPSSHVPAAANHSIPARCRTTKGRA